MTRASKIRSKRKIPLLATLPVLPSFGGVGISGSLPPAMTNTITSGLATWDGTPVATNVVTANLAEWN